MVNIQRKRAKRRKFNRNSNFLNTSLLKGINMTNETQNPPRLQPLVPNISESPSLMDTLKKQREFVLQSIVFIPSVGKFEVAILDVNHTLRKENLIKVNQDTLEEALGFINRMDCSNGRSTDLFSS